MRQTDVMDLLDLHGPMTIRQIVNSHYKVDQGDLNYQARYNSVTSALSKLMHYGLVERAEAPTGMSLYIYRRVADGS